MNKQILLEINRLRELMSLSNFQNENLINEQMAQVLTGLEKQIGNRWLSSIMSEYINRLINTSIKKAGKAIDPDTFIKNNLDKVVKEVQTNVGRALTEAEKNTLESGMRVEIAKLVQAANKKAPTKVAKDSTKQGQKNVVDKLATRQPGQFTKQTTSQGGETAAATATRDGAESTAVMVAKESAESTVTKNWIRNNLSRLGESLKRLNRTKGWVAIKNHFKRNYGKYAIAGGITALAVFFYYYGDDEVPADAETYNQDNALVSTSNEAGVYTTPGDPYQYKVIECVWHTKGGPRNIPDWRSLADRPNAIAILDERYPDARKNCNTQIDSGSVTPTTTTPSLGNVEDDEENITSFSSDQIDEM